MFNNLLPYMSLSSYLLSDEEFRIGLNYGQMIFKGVSVFPEGTSYANHDVIFIYIKIENGKTYTQNKYRKQYMNLLK